jgi:hypothetical protein
MDRGRARHFCADFTIARSVAVRARDRRSAVAVAADILASRVLCNAKTRSWHFRSQ